jgi:hypothetical protein
MKCSQADTSIKVRWCSSISGTDSVPISNTLKMGMESVPETLENFHALMWLSAQEHFIDISFLSKCIPQMSRGSMQTQFFKWLTQCETQYSLSKLRTYTTIRMEVPRKTTKSLTQLISKPKFKWDLSNMKQKCYPLNCSS